MIRPHDVRLRWAAMVFGAAMAGCGSPLPEPTPTASLSPTPTATLSATPTFIPSPTAAPAPTLPPESPVDTSDWSALVWSEGTFESPAPGVAVRVTDVARWGDGYIAVGSGGVPNDESPPDGLIWLSEDGLDWHLVSTDTFDGAELCCVTRARDAFIAWTARSGIFLSSIDGRHWTRTEPADEQGMVVTETSDGLFALPRGLFSGQVFATADGIGWQSLATTGLHLRSSAGFGMGMGSMRASRVGILVAGPAAEGGVAGVIETWGNWFSRDGVEWQEVRFEQGEEPWRGRNAGWFEEGHDAVYGHEFFNSGVYFGDWVVFPIWRTEDGVTWAKVDSLAFPAVGRYDGHITFDLSALADDGTVRLSADGQTILTLTSAGGARPGTAGSDFGPSAIGPSGIVVFGMGSGEVWFGRAVTAP